MPGGMGRPEPRTNFGHPVLGACREEVRRPVWRRVRQPGALASRAGARKSLPSPRPSPGGRGRSAMGLRGLVSCGAATIPLHREREKMCWRGSTRCA
jgi:hypothetical protein